MNMKRHSSNDKKKLDSGKEHLNTDNEADELKKLNG
jgi:hypothetical protein